MSNGNDGGGGCCLLIVLIAAFFLCGGYAGCSGFQIGTPPQPKPAEAQP